MPENLPESILASKQRAEAFLQEVVVPLGDQIVPEAIETVRQASKEAGFFYKTQPVEFGGDPASTLELTVLREAFSAANSDLTAYIFGPGPGVLHAAEGDQKTRYLEPVLRGEKRGAFGFTEPDKAPRPSWGLVRGDEIVINGQKSYVTGGTTADFVSALINVENEDGSKAGTAMIVIDREDAGVTIDREFSSLDGSSHASMTFEDVHVPLNRVVGKLGEGMPRALANIGNVRMMVAAQAMGMCLWALDYIEGHLKGPHRSGAPLGDREGVRLRYADMRIESYVARSALYRTARLVDSGENAVNETAAAKVFTTETAGRVVDSAVQLFGGQALVSGHPLEKLYRQARSLRFVEGASDLLRLNLAKGRFELNKGRV
jgi:alkylation response protein AidB-like acyl-CoA dehydrogenase